MRHISKLGLKLMAIVLVLILVPLSLTYLITQASTKDILEAKIKVINSNATDAAYQELERFVIEAEKLTQEIAKSDTIGLFLTGMGDFIKSDLEKIIEKSPWVKRFEIVAEDGTYVTYPDTEEEEDIKWLQKPWYTMTKKEDKLLWFPAINHLDQFRTAIPLKLTHSDELAGILSIVIDMEEVKKFLQQFGVEEGAFLLVNQTGAVVSTDKDIESHDLYLDQQSFFSDAFKSEELQFGVYEYGGEKRLTFIRYIPELKSILILQVPEKVAYQEVYNLLSKLWGIGLITLAIVFVVTILATRHWITTRIVRVVKAAESVADGDLQNTISVKSMDEIGQLAHSFNIMVSGLRDLIDDILQSSEQVARSSEQIHESAGMSAKISDQVAQSIQQVASGADNQSELIDEVNQKLLDLSKSIEGLSHTSQDVQKIARNTQEKANLGARSMDRVNQQMDVIQHSIADSTKVINDMTKATDEIGNFVNIIDSIANQTNLLALNAAIEAARAGEEGRGFAVVAGEIRSLAEEVSVSAGKIRHLVQIIQSHSHEASSAMEDGVKQIQLGQEVLNESSTIYNDIFQSFEETLEAIKLVDQMTSSVAQNTGLIVEGAEKIAGIAEENAAAAEEVSASTEEQAAAMEEITRLAESMTSLSKALESLVQRFKL